MSLENNKATVRRLFEVENTRTLAALDELIAPDYVHNTLQLRGLESYKQLNTEAFKAFPDFHETIEDIVAEGDKVWIRFTGTGTHRGEWSVPQALTPAGKKMTLAPTGKKITFTAVLIYRIVNGKVAECWGVYDFLEFYSQLGVIDYKGFPDEVS